MCAASHSDVDPLQLGGGIATQHHTLQGEDLPGQCKHKRLTSNRRPTGAISLVYVEKLQLGLAPMSMHEDITEAILVTSKCRGTDLPAGSAHPYDDPVEKPGG